MNVVRLPVMARPPRFRLLVDNGSLGPTTLEVVDRGAQHRLAQWRGPIAKRLLESAALPRLFKQSGTHECDKAFVQQLMLAAAVIDLPREITCARRCGPIPCRDRRDDDGRSVLHIRLVQMLNAHPGHHFSQDDIVCLTLLENPALNASRIILHLDDIVRWRLVQRIRIDDDHVFYDLDTRPHLHVYDTRRRILMDAPDKGCLKI